MNATEMTFSIAPYLNNGDLEIDMLDGDQDIGTLKFPIAELVDEYLFFNGDDDGFIEDEVVDQTYLLIDNLEQAIRRLNDAIRD